MEKQDALIHSPAPALKVERRTWCKAHKIEFVVRKALTIAFGEFGRQHRKAGCERTFDAATDLEFLEVGASNRSVAADVNDVDSTNCVPKVFHSAGYNAASYQCLSEPYFVGDKKTGRAVRSGKEAIKSMIHSAALKGFEGLQYF